MGLKAFLMYTNQKQLIVSGVDKSLLFVFFFLYGLYFFLLTLMQRGTEHFLVDSWNIEVFIDTLNIAKIWNSCM